MTDTVRPNSYDDTPVYTIKTVVRETHIASATLRAWERRYGCLSPGRSEGGYRLYSERDIAILRWLKRQIDAGVSISRAVALLEMRHDFDEGAMPLETGAPAEMHLPSQGAHPAGLMTEDLVQALLAYDEVQAEAILSEAFALHSVDVVAEEVIGPALVMIGERWHQGETSIVQEHFATAFLRRRLTALFHAYEHPHNGPLAVTGSGPEEWHDVGILMVSIALRRHGWRVIYLGQNVPAEQLMDQIRTLQPAAICLSASTRDSGAALAKVHDAVDAMPEPRPKLFLGGRAFNTDPELYREFPGALVAANPRELLAHLASRQD